jgi:uncharacterized protein YndB with AHSA1/START domain
METEYKNKIIVRATINTAIEKVWEFWTLPEHIIQWCSANDDWHTPRAENDLRQGGKFVSRMEAKDGSMGFDFGGVYDNVIPNELIEYTIGDGRKVIIEFTSNGKETKIVETFDAENENSIELQYTGWQAILDNFIRYAERNK